MLIKRALPAILVAATTQLAMTNAHACRCAGPQTLQRAFKTAEVVVLSEVLAVEGNFEAEGGAVATLKASKAWKASVPATLRVETRTTCAFDFRKGESYLVYLTRSNGRAPYSTTICSGNLRARDADAALEWLGRRTKPASVGR